MFVKRCIERMDVISTSLGERELKSLTEKEAEELCQLATDLCIISFDDVKDAIANGITYSSTQVTLMELYDKHLSEILNIPEDNTYDACVLF